MPDGRDSVGSGLRETDDGRGPFVPGARIRVQYKECGEEMSLGSMAGNMRTQHGRAAEGRRSWEASPPGEESRTYRISFQSTGIPGNCPVEGCPGQVATRTAMQIYFLHRHARGTVVILEEGNPPHPR